MRKQIKALGMALFAAMAVLAAVDPFWRQSKGAAAGYEEFSACPALTEGSIKTARRKGIVEVCKSIQNALAEFKVIFGSPAPSSNADSEGSGFGLTVHLAALDTREAWGGGSVRKEMAPDVAVADISGCA